MLHIRKLLPFVKPYWVPALISLVLLIALAVMDLSIPRLVEQIIDVGIKDNNLDVVVQTSLLMLGISALSTLVAIGNNIYSIRAGEGVARDLREAIFVRLQSFSYGNLDTFSTGELMVRLTSDTSAWQRMVQISLRIGTRGPLMMVGSLALMFITAPALALTILPLLVVTAVIIVVFSSRLEPLFRVTQQKLDRLNTVLQENIAGVRLVKAFVRARYEGERFESANEDFTNRTVRVMQFMAAMGPALSILVNIGMVIVVWAGGLQSIQGDLSIGQIVAFTNYLLSTMNPLIMMTNLITVWANGIASAQRINRVLDTVPEVQEQAQAHPFGGIVQGRVTFENVSFHYNGSQGGLVLDGINLEAEPGQTVAILGATGSGKTSLIHLVPRFYDPTAGRVLIDGQDIRQLRLDSLLQHIAVVPQETVLFSGSVADNIRYGRPEASDEEVIAAASAAQAHEFILNLPSGYDTHVEERGVNLSGGQKQRIAIARALVARPKILILDDSTSSVDIETETRIQNALDEQLAGCTRFVVAQRISTVLNAGKIAVLERGRLAALGTHAELMQTSRIYREIYNSQLGNGFGQRQPAALLAEESPC